MSDTVEINIADYVAMPTIYKLSNGAYGLSQLSDTTVDKGQASVSLIISTANEDRSRDIVVPSGLDTKNHRANPVVFLEHGLRGLPIPVGLAVDDKSQYTVYCDETQPHKPTRATTHFNQKSREAMEVFELIAEGYIRGGSIGFRPHVMEYRHTEPTPSRPYGGLLVKEAELVEYSHVIIPDHPEALVQAVSRKSFSAPVLKALTPYLPELPVQVAVPAPPPVEKKMADPVTAPESRYVPVQDTPTEPAGATSLRALHDRFIEQSQFLEGQLALQDNPAIKSMYTELLDDLNSKIALLHEEFKKQYPQSEPLDKGFSTAEQDKPAREVLKARVAVYHKTIDDLITKRLGKGHVSACMGAAGHLDTLSGHDKLDDVHKSACKYHSGVLKSLCEGKKDEDDDKEQKALQERLTKLQEAYDILVKSMPAPRYRLA